jgi:hypothetical protein
VNQDIIYAALFLAILAMPIIGPAIIAALFNIPVPIKLTLIFSGCLTGIYTYILYQHALEKFSTYPSSLAILAVGVAEYIFAAYITTTCTSLVGLIRAIALRKSWQTLCGFAIVVTACVVIGQKYELYEKFASPRL